MKKLFGLLALAGALLAAQPAAAQATAPSPVALPAPAADVYQGAYTFLVGVLGFTPDQLQAALKDSDDYHEAMLALALLYGYVPKP